MEVKRNGVLMLKGVRNGSLYYLCGLASTSEDQANSVKSESIEVWHLRGHPADGSVKELLKKEVIHGTPERLGQPCENVFLAKQRSFLTRKVNILQRLLLIMCIVICEGLPRSCLLVKENITCLLLMISLERLGFIFLKKSRNRAKKEIWLN